MDTTYDCRLVKKCVQKHVFVFQQNIFNSER